MLAFYMYKINGILLEPAAVVIKNLEDTQDKIGIMKYFLLRQAEPKNTIIFCNIKKYKFGPYWLKQKHEP